jgi:hypothetical protein
VEDVADRSPVDAESGTQLVSRCTSQVALDQCLGLIGVELPGPSLFGRWAGGGAGVVGSGSLRSRVSRASTWGFVL